MHISSPLFLVFGSKCSEYLYNGFARPCVCKQRSTQELLGLGRQLRCRQRGLVETDSNPYRQSKSQGSIPRYVENNFQLRNYLVREVVEVSLKGIANPVTRARYRDRGSNFQLRTTRPGKSVQVVVEKVLQQFFQQSIDHPNWTLAADACWQHTCTAID